MRGIDPEIWDIVVNGGRDRRVYIVSENPLYYALYYHSEYFSYPLAPYHYDMFDDLYKLGNGQVKEVAWIMYRESGKTSIAKIGEEWLGITKKKLYINKDSYDRGNSEASLFDIAVSMQSNKRLIADFGHLFHKKLKKGAEKESTMKRVANFITNKGVKYEAFSTQESTRGRLFKEHRPDHYTFDDVETTKTKDSQPVTEKIIGHIEEARAGMGVSGTVLYLGNKIRDDGVVAHIIEVVKKSGGIVRDIPVMDTVSKEIAWPEKYVHTDIEAAEANRYIEDKYQRKVSIQAKQRELENFEAEMMNNPAKSGDLYFNRILVLQALEKAKTVPVLKDNGGMSVWFEYNPAHRYSIGGDTAEGIGRDANASAVINHSMRPARVVATYASDIISPHDFGYELAREGRIYGECFCVPEINNTGYATVASLVSPDNANYTNVYRRQVKNKVNGKVSDEFGWRSTVGTKADIMAYFKKTFEDGDLEIFDTGLLNEMLNYTKKDAFVISKKEEGTRHFDKLRAAALALEGGKYAVAKKDEETMYKSPNSGANKAPYIP